MKNPKSDPKASSRYHHGDLRRSLIEAALELLEQEGAEQLSLRGVARRAGVSHTAPYHHFADRGALVAALAEEGFKGLADAIEKRTMQITDSRSRLVEAGTAYVLFALRHPARFRLMFSPELAGNRPASLEQVASATFAILLGAIERYQEQGQVRPGDPRGYARAAWATVHGLAMLLLDGHLPGEKEDPAELEQLARNVTETLWMGLEVR